ncbi:hypothetical protein HDU92_009141 [Lobulomyces angularis]|nr:hypothetical protein HDU92_009141 [Lobulomyces angularis]
MSKVVETKEATKEFEINPRGIPRAPFIEKIEEYITPEESEKTLEKFNEMFSKFKFMEAHLNQKKVSLESKIPELADTNQVVQHLMKQKEESEDKPIDVQYELNDTLWVNAKIDSTDIVYLWLGANVMLEYTTEEANKLLTTKLQSATTSLSQVKEDLEYLREQITTIEVNIARVYNYDVKNRREGKVKQKDVNKK